MILVILGAGASVDSGLPTYQHTAKDPEEILNRLTLSKDPGKLWHFLGPLLRSVDPGITYHALARWLASHSGEPDDVLIINQNIDGIATRVLGDRYSVIELHGNVHHSTCLVCGWSGLTTQTITHLDNGQICPSCTATCRPDIVLYRESPDQYYRDRIKRFIKTKERGGLVLILGTSLRLSYIRRWVNDAKQRGCKVVHINSDPQYSQPYWEPRPYGHGGRYRSLVGKGELWVRVEDPETLTTRPANIVEGLDLLGGILHPSPDQ